LVFTGTYEHTIDAKNRLAIPSSIRTRVSRGGEETGVWFVTLGPNRTVCIYTEAGFQKRADELDSSERDPSEVLDYETFFFSMAHDVEMDKAGRLRLPQLLLDHAKLGKDVVLLGIKDHLEVRDRKQWNETINDMLENRPELLMNPRQAMRAKRSSNGSGQTPDG